MKATNIYVFGLGAIGANIVLNIMRDIPDALITGIDYDIVDRKNYEAGTQPYLKENLGWKKTQAMRIISFKTVGRQIDILDKKLEHEEDAVLMIENGKQSDDVLLIDAFDNFASRNVVSNLKYPSVHVGFSPFMTGEVLWNEGYTKLLPYKGDLAEVDICTQHSIRSFIMMFTSMASLVINEYYYNDKKVNLFIDKFFNMKVF